MVSQPQCCINKIFTFVYFLVYFRLNMSVEQTVKRCNALSKNQILSNRSKTRMLLHRSYMHGEHKEFKEHMENNPVKENFEASLKHGITLVVDETQTMSEVAPTMITLLQNGAKWGRIVRLMPSERTPYHIICDSTGDHHDLLELMIKDLKKSSLNAKDNKKCTALMYAVQNANVKCVKSLIANGADVNSMSSIHSLQARPNVKTMITDAVSPLVDSINLLHLNSPNSPDTMMDIFDILLDSGADVNQPCLDLRRTPIMFAAEVGNMHCFGKLIEKGAEIDCADKNGYTLCRLAAYGGNVEMLKYLLEDIDIYKNSIHKKGLRLLYGAVCSGNFEALRYLLKLGVKIRSCITKECVGACIDCRITAYWHTVNNQTRTNSQWTSCYQFLLITVCQIGSVKMVKLLLEHGVDPNINMCEAELPSTINVAIFNQHVEVIACFIRGGVNVNTRSYHASMGMMLPFEVAVYLNHINAAEMLLVTGCSHGVLSLDRNNHKLKYNINSKMRNLLKKWNVHNNAVLPLQQRCRMVILNHLSPQADKKITELPLPLVLIKYLSISELDDIIKIIETQTIRV